LDMQSRSSGSVRVFYPEYDTERLVQELKGKLVELEERIPLSKVILFGSFAKGSYTAASDVDLLVVYKGEEKKEDAYATIKKILRIPRLEPHVYSELEYEAVKETINKMTEGGIVLR